MKSNVRGPGVRTHEGGKAVVLSPLLELRRHVLATLLFEDSFYENGQDQATRIQELAKRVSFDELAQVATEARTQYKLRHIPLLLTREAVRLHKGRKVGDLIFTVVQRPDELGELLALYWKDKKDAPIANQLKIGLARALKKFTPYSLAKYKGNEKSAVKLRDVMFLTHAKPKGETQEALFKQIADQTLETPDTWEANLSGGADKKDTFERLILEGKLGALATLRNLRNMKEAGVQEELVIKALRDMKTERVLPFRFITASRFAPQYEPVLEQKMLECLGQVEKLPGKTTLIVDASDSMKDRLSQKSEVNRLDTACGLAILLREVCEEVRIFEYSNDCFEVPARRGFALRDVMVQRAPWGGTNTASAIAYGFTHAPQTERVIVLTDEQSHDGNYVLPPHVKGYVVNLAGYQHGIAYGKWVSVAGWSEAIIEFIRALEAFNVSAMDA